MPKRVREEEIARRIAFITTERPCGFCGEMYLPSTHRQIAWCGKKCRGRANRLWLHYRLRPEDFRRLWDEQHGRCALPGCRALLDRFACHVDHDHDTEQVRGLLCRQCNWIEGIYKQALTLGVPDYLEATDATRPPHRQTYFVQTGGMHENPYGVPREEIVRFIIDNPAETVAQVVFGKYVEASGLVFGSEIVQSMFRRELEPINSNFWIDRDARERAKPIVARGEDYLPPFHTGVDFARQTDYTVLTTIDTSTDPAKCVYYKRLNRVPWETIYTEVGIARMLWGPNILADASGPQGDVIMDALESRHFCTEHRRTSMLGNGCQDDDGNRLNCDPSRYQPLSCVEGYQFGGGTGEAKRRLVEHLRNVMSTGYRRDRPELPFGQLRMPPIVQLEEEITFYTWMDKDLDTDCLFSLCLAAWSGLEEVLPDPDFGSVYGD